MRTVKRIVKINKVDGYRVHCLFDNGAARVIDFCQLFKKWQVKDDDWEYPLLNDEHAFGQVTLEGGTLIWKNIEIVSTDETGASVVDHYELDPIVLYEASEPDEAYQLPIGALIKQARKSVGLTQEQLAQRSGTTKHHISRIENNRVSIELATLLKIVEGGLGKKLRIGIE